MKCALRRSMYTGAMAAYRVSSCEKPDDGNPLPGTFIEIIVRNRRLAETRNWHEKGRLIWAGLLRGWRPMVAYA